MIYEDKIAAMQFGISSEHEANTIFQNCKHKPLAIVFNHAQDFIDMARSTSIDVKG